MKKRSICSYSCYHLAHSEAPSLAITKILGSVVVIYRSCGVTKSYRIHRPHFWSILPESAAQLYYTWDFTCQLGEREKRRKELDFQEATKLTICWWQRFVGSLRYRVLLIAKFLRKLGIFPCARARVFLIEIGTTYQHHLFLDLFFDRLGNSKAIKVLIIPIPSILGTATRPSI